MTPISLLLATDGSEPSLEAARLVRDLLNPAAFAHVTILAVVPPLEMVPFYGTTIDRRGTVRPEEARSWFHGLRIGTNIPGVVTADTFYTGNGKVFYGLHDPEKTIAIELKDDSYQRVITAVDDPEATAERISASLA